jgi:uncharacterized membrane protein
MNEGLFAVGVILVFIGVLAAGYTIYNNQSYFFGAWRESTATRPYAHFSVPLIILGVLLMVVGAIMLTVKTSTKHSYVETPIRKTKVVETEG